MATVGKRKPKLRGNGQGTVRKLPSGRHRWEITLGYRPDGTRISSSGVCDTKTEAESARSQAITDRDRGVLTARDAATVSEFAAKWLSRQRDLRPRSVNLYGIELGYALERIGHLKVRDVRKGHLEDLMSALAARVMAARGEPKTMSPRTQGKVLTRLRSVFRDAVADGILHKDPTSGVKRVKAPPIEATGITLDFHEADRFHELGWALHDAGLCRLWPALLTALSIGARRGEVLGLTWANVDLERGVLKIRQARTVDDGEATLTGTKTFRSSRDVPMPASLQAALRGLRDRQESERQAAGAAWRGSGAVFATELGAWTHPSFMNRALDCLLRWSDPAAFATMGETARRLLSAESFARLEAIVLSGERLPEVSPHDLRHSFATLALRRRVPVEVVSKILGHAKVSITMDIYRHVLESEQREHVLDLFDRPLPDRAARPSVAA